MAYKTFEVPPPPDGDPIGFEIAGRKYTCLARIPIGTRMLMRMGRITKGDVIPFIRGCLTEDDRLLWDELVVDPNVLLDDKTCEDIFWYLIEEYANRTGEEPLAIPDKK